MMFEQLGFWSSIFICKIIMLFYSILQQYNKTKMNLYKRLSQLFDTPIIITATQCTPSELLTVVKTVMHVDIHNTGISCRLASNCFTHIVPSPEWYIKFTTFSLKNNTGILRTVIYFHYKDIQINCIWHHP